MSRKEVSVKIDMQVGPVKVEWEAPEGSELFHIDPGEFVQKVMQLMEYVGTADDPPDDPEPVLPERLPEAFPEPPEVRPSWSFEAPLTSSPDVELEPIPVQVFDDEEEDAEDFDYDTDSGETPSGRRVGRVGGTNFAKKVDGES